MAKDISLKIDRATLVKTFRRITAPIRTHHTVIMFVLIMSVLIYSVLLVSMTLQPTDDSDYRSQVEATSVTTRFDQETIKKIDALNQSSTNAPIQLPEGRRNPFVD